MTVAVANDVTRGQSTLDSVRSRAPPPGKMARTTSRFVCIPYSGTPVSFSETTAIHGTPAAPVNSPPQNIQRIYPIPVKERVYDLGWRENWRQLLARPLFDPGTPRQG